VSYKTLIGTKQIVVNMNIFDIIPPDEMKRYQHSPKTPKTQMPRENVDFIDITSVIKGGDKTIIEKGNVNQDIVNKNPMYTEAIYLNVNRQKQGKEIQKESEETFRRFVETASDAMLITDKNGKFTWVNDSMVRTFGYSKEEVIGMHITQFLTEETLATAFKSKTEQLVTKGEISFEETWITKTGKEVYGELNVVAFYNSDGKYAGGRGVFRDLTERKQVEEKIKELYRREKELRYRVEEEMKSRVEFTRALIHELKTPLTTILASVELLTDEGKNEQESKLLGCISRGSLTMNKRVDTLLDLVKGEMNMLELNFSEVDPLQLLRRMADDMTLVASSRGLILDIELPSSLPLVWADEGRLEQVLQNLLTNAFKWSKEGGRVTLRAKEEDIALIVEVKDTGPGITKENQQKIFKPYYRITAESRVVGGLGLGLALCKTILDSHSGEIWVESEEGKGSTFIFSIPFYVAAK
jgi:PAS domain S-box-containing protein